MKQQLSLLTSAAVLAVASQASAQGLLSIGHNSEIDFERKSPLAWIVGMQVGWDSNPGISSFNEQDSAYIVGSIEVNYNTGDRRTAYNFFASYSPLYYFDAPSNRDEFENAFRGGFDIRHRINPRLTITNSTYVSYEVEPNYQIGATVARNTQPYFYGHNSLAAAYAWNRRFSTVTSWTILGVSYDGGVGNDYFTNIFANEFRYAMSRTTTAALTYRYADSNFDNSIADYDSHYVLGGVDHRFSPQMTGSFRAGAEFRESDSTPYVETALTYRVSRTTDFRWYSSYGFSTNGSGTMAGGDSANLHTGLTALHRFNSRFTGNLGAHYFGEDVGFDDQDVFAATVGFAYVLYRNVSLNGGYTYTTASSDNPFLEFDRHQVQLGVSAQF